MLSFHRVHPPSSTPTITLEKGPERSPLLLPMASKCSAHQSCQSSRRSDPYPECLRPNPYHRETNRRRIPTILGHHSWIPGLIKCREQVYSFGWLCTSEFQVLRRRNLREADLETTVSDHASGRGEAIVGCPSHDLRRHPAYTASRFTLSD